MKKNPNTGTYTSHADRFFRLTQLSMPFHIFVSVPSRPPLASKFVSLLCLFQIRDTRVLCGLSLKTNKKKKPFYLSLLLSLSVSCSAGVCCHPTPRTALDWGKISARLQSALGPWILRRNKEGGQRTKQEGNQKVEWPRGPSE